MAVMVDDLVTRGTNEPYRIFTSRAEYRLLLREDNADVRLLGKAYELGLHSRSTFQELLERREAVASELERLRSTPVRPSAQVDEVLTRRSSSPLNEAVSLDKLLKRPEISYGDIELLAGPPEPLPERVKEQVEVECKYEGYLKRQEADVRKFRHIVRIVIPSDIEYDTIPSLSKEIRYKLAAIRPLSLGQASRIPGITPAALSVLMIYLKQRSFGHTKPTPD
jgi:tRNA uridine 5-carboxymethylaminomethyl modification enzyme